MPGKLESHARDWEELAGFDPMWAILSDKRKRGRKWDEVEFFQSGEMEVERELRQAGKFVPRSVTRVLDFGCGMGRLTRALGKRFGEAWGVDISERMIEAAKEANRNHGGCHFVVNRERDLKQFPDSHFDLVLSFKVLQHVPKDVIPSYIAEFVRVLRPGGLLLFQLPDELSFIRRFQPKRTVFKLLNQFGIDAQTLLKGSSLHPMLLNAIPEDRIIRDTPAKFLTSYASDDGKVHSKTYCFSK